MSAKDVEQKIVAATSVDDLIRKIQRTGAEVLLYRGLVMTRPESKIPEALRAEIDNRHKELRAFLAAKLSADRAESGVAHKWVIRLGDTKPSRSGSFRPAYLACGPHDFCMRMIHQAHEFSDPANRYERERWIILEQDQVGAVVKNDRGVLIATVVALPDGASLGGPPGSSAEVLSACESCLEPPLSGETVAEITKVDD